MALTAFVIIYQDSIVINDKTRKPIIGLKLYPAGLAPTMNSSATATISNIPLSSTAPVNRNVKGEAQNSRPLAAKLLSSSLRSVNETQTESTEDKNVTISTTIPFIVSCAVLKM